VGQWSELRVVCHNCVGPCKTALRRRRVIAVLAVLKVCHRLQLRAVCVCVSRPSIRSRITLDSSRTPVRHSPPTPTCAGSEGAGVLTACSASACASTTVHRRKRKRLCIGGVATCEHPDIPCAPALWGAAPLPDCRRCRRRQRLVASRFAVARQTAQAARCSAATEESDAPPSSG